MRRFVWVCAFNLIVCLPFKSVQAVESKPIFAIADFYPFGRVTKDGKNEGLFWEIFSFVKKQTGISFDDDMLPISRLNRSLVTGTIDFAITGASTKAIQNTISLGTVGCSRIVVQTSEASKIETIADLQGRSIGFAAGGFLYRLFGTKYGMKSIQVRHSESFFRMMDRDRLDGFFASDLVVDTFIKEGVVEGKIDANWQQRLGPRVEVRVVPVRLRMATQSKYKDLQDKIREAVAFGVKEKVFEKIYESYGVQSKGRCD